MSKNLVRRVSIITDKTTKVRKVLITTLVLNIFVMILKVVVAWWTGSLSLLADVLHSLT
ncbi:cation transporter, partial [Richelia intracellularis]|uniref:cation transporter n=1 Tax=Richelia intracellularis TaxID=1164990 RepID=UPI0018C8CD51